MPSEMVGLHCRDKPVNDPPPFLSDLSLVPTILDKTVEKMSHSQTIFPNILPIPRPPFPPPLGSNVVVCSKATLILKHL